MKLEIRSKKLAEEFTCDRPWAAISISSDETRYANLKEENRVGLLQMTFADLAFRSLAYPDDKLFDEEAARQIFNFVDNVANQVEVLLVHCEAGMSRSAAIAAAVDKIYLKREDCKPYWKSHTPNPLVYQILVVMAVLENRIPKSLVLDLSNDITEILAMIELEVNAKVKAVNPVNVCSFRDTPKDAGIVINTTSRSTTWSKGLSPFFCGPVDLYDIYVAKNVENAWQYAKVYPKFVDENLHPTEDYFLWAQTGWNKKTADRYPMGKGAQPLYSYWDGQKLGYIEARRKIYAPLYAKAVQETEAFTKLKELYDKGEQIWLWDFDGYDFRKKGMTYTDVLLNEKRKMGHAFVLAMLLENQKVWENA